MIQKEKIHLSVGKAVPVGISAPDRQSEICNKMFRYRVSIGIVCRLNR